MARVDLGLVVKGREQVKEEAKVEMRLGANEVDKINAMLEIYRGGNRLR